MAELDDDAKAQAAALGNTLKQHGTTSPKPADASDIWNKTHPEREREARQETEQNRTPDDDLKQKQ